MAQGYKLFRRIAQDADRRLKQHQQETEKNMETNDTTGKVEMLKKFASFLFKHSAIDGYMDEGEVKQSFSRQGKKAFKELADYLGLKQYDVSFNPSGDAVSGDIRLMGMFSSDKGIYISLNKNGMQNGVLYRSIKHLKDYSGGSNNYFPESEFESPEKIKQRIYSLLHLSEQVEEKFLEKTIPEQQTATVKNTEQKISVKELYDAISEGREIERLPELITYLHDRNNKEEIKARGLNVFDVIYSERFVKKLNRNLWDLIPEEYKKLRTINALEWEASPDDKGVQHLVENFLSKDKLRSHLMGANFDGKGIVATDTHKLIFLNKVKSGKKGIYCLTKLCFQAFAKEGNGNAAIEMMFPDYAAAIPKEIKFTHAIPTDTLRRYCTALINVGMTNKMQHRGALKYGEGQYMGMDLTFLLSAAESFERLGEHTIDIGFATTDKPLLIAGEGKMKDVSTLSTPFVLVMPLAPMGHDEHKNKIYTMEKGIVYLNVKDGQVYTYGVEEKKASEKNQKEETVKNKSQQMSREETKNLLSADEWFKQHPEKILGEAFQTTDRFGKAVTKIRGTADNIVQGIDVPVVDVQEETTEALQTEVKEPLDYLTNDPQKKENMQRVVHRTKKEHAEKALRTLNGETEKSSSENELTKTFSFDHVMREYNKGISEDEIKAWIWYKRTTGGFNYEKTILDFKNGWSKYVVPLGQAEKHLKSWLEKGIICSHNGSFIPSVLYYAENIYERQRMLFRDKEAIIKEFGKEQYERQWEGLERVKPIKLTLNDPDTNNRLFIKPDSTFAKEIYIKQLADGTTFQEYVGGKGTYVEGTNSLIDAFRIWLRELPNDEFKKSTSWNIIHYYLESGSASRHYDKEEKLRLKQNAKQEGDQFFVRFLAEALTREDQIRIEQEWNSNYNGYAEINYFKVPVAFTCSGTFKNKPLFIRPVQREGIGFISVHGSGCVAYDVGLGKTMTAILSIAMALESGQCKRPFIVVPNQTYKNWIAEIGGVVEKGKVVLSGLLPQYQVIDLYNLGEEYVDRLRDDKGKIQAVPEMSISVLTYEGFNRLGFNDKTWSTIGSELYDILNQGTEERRDMVKLGEKINELMGKGIKGGTVNIEDLGFDYFAVDEAHAMKKSFTQVKGEVKGETGKRVTATYQIQSGSPSMTALRGFMISQYILRNNNMRNVVLLTATPFTNSPLEIYSILALIGYQQLEKWGIKNIKEFFDTFIKTSMELVINAKLKPERKEIVMGFNNLIALQQLIFKFITYKTGEDAKIQRPNKIVLPMLYKKEGAEVIPLPPNQQVSTNLPMTATQKEYMNDVEMYVRGMTSLTNFCVNNKGFEDDEEEEEHTVGEVLDEKHLSTEEEEGTRVLRGMSFARQLALSPYLYACNPDKHPTYSQYIESSPKLNYVMQCIQSVKRYHEEHQQEVSGQVIYMNAGVHFFPLIKEYLVQKVGYKEDEVGIIKSGVSAAKKEGIKERFLAGSVKIIIGSATIKEGINLQNRSTVLYNCWLDWNPTDVKQLEGRIWRFGNMYANVRIVNPLMEDSIDSFIFQKLEEKTSRINEIWYRAGKTNALSLEEFNPSELKMGLITDPMALAELILMGDRERLQDEITGLTNQKTELEEIVKEREIFNTNIAYVKDTVSRYRPQKEEGKARSIEAILKIYKDYLEDTDMQSTFKDQMMYSQVRKANTAIKRAIEQILSPRGLDIGFDLKKATGQINKEIERKEKYKEEKTGEEAIERKAQTIIEERIKKGYKPKTVAERVKEFSNMNPKLLTELMVYDTSEEAKEKKTQQLQRGQELETSSDTVDELEALIRDMEEMDHILSELEELQKAA